LEFRRVLFRSSSARKRTKRVESPGTTLRTHPLLRRRPVRGRQRSWYPSYRDPVFLEPAGRPLVEVLGDLGNGRGFAMARVDDGVPGQADKVITDGGDQGRKVGGGLPGDTLPDRKKGVTGGDHGDLGRRQATTAGRAPRGRQH